ncbi:MAG: phosphoglucosamine mutase [Erysipelotrichaceae bacterium]|nr:MAG: phosphoglucosamine [Erysipelotrichaceae bacterium]TXT18320.1 MAG: phosphoglucosamine mutase [Erysipelotrichaceae bacterium]
MGQYFGTDGVRGKANVVLTVDMAFQIGQALGAIYPKSKIVVGMDTRLSSGMLKYAVCAGIAASSAHAYDVGVVPTPTIAYLCSKEDFIAGVMISASHNPYYDNGIKIFNHQGLKIDDQIEALIEKVLNKETHLILANDTEIGKIDAYPQGLDHYIRYISSIYPIDLSGLNIAIDAANGSACVSAKMVLESMHANVLSMHDNPNGININNHCGSTHPGDLQKFVIKHQCDVGLAFDGDADRLIAVDEQGNLIDGDKTIYICALNMMKHKQLNQDTVVTTVMANLGLYKALQDAGIKTEQTQVGDKYVYDRMLLKNLSLGGEQSGHIIFKEYLSTGDGLLTALSLLSIMVEEKKGLAELSKDLIIYPQTLINVHVTNKHTALENPILCEHIALLQKALGTEGRILVRPSGTEPLVRVMAEASTQDQCDDLVSQIVTVIEREHL